MRLLSGLGAGTAFHRSPFPILLTQRAQRHAHDKGLRWVRPRLQVAVGIDDIPSRISNVIEVATNDYTMRRIALGFGRTFSAKRASALSQSTRLVLTSKTAIPRR
jgi:hypothetical protein